MRSLPAELQWLASSHCGVLRTSQLAPHGFNKREIDARIGAGVWRRVSSRVIAPQPDAPSRTGLLWAASLHHLHVGLTGAAALEVCGLPAPKDGRILLLGPRGTRLSPFDGCRIITCDQPKFSDHAGPLRTPAALSTAYAMGTATSLRQAVFHCTWAVQRRLASLDEIRTAIVNAPASPTMAAARRALDCLDPGVHSLHEYDFARECRRRGLPTPIRQAPRMDSEGRFRYLDAEFRMPHGSLVVEIDGEQHLQTRQSLDDSWRSNELGLQQSHVLRVPGVALRTDADRFFEQIKRKLAQLGWH